VGLPLKTLIAARITNPRA